MSVYINRLSGNVMTLESSYRIKLLNAIKHKNETSALALVAFVTNINFVFTKPGSSTKTHCIDYAIENGMSKLVKEMIEKGANFKHRDGLGRTLLHHAHKLDYPQIAQTLFDLYPKLGLAGDYERVTPLHLAIKYHHNENLKKYLVHFFPKAQPDAMIEAQPQADDAKPDDLQELIYSELPPFNFETISTLVDVNGDTLLHWCAQYGNLEAAQYLLAYNAKGWVVNKNNQTPYDVCPSTNVASELGEQLKELLAKNKTLSLLDRCAIAAAKLSTEEKVELPDEVLQKTEFIPGLYLQNQAKKCDNQREFERTKFRAEIKAKELDVTVDSLLEQVTNPDMDDTVRRFSKLYLGSD